MSGSIPISTLNNLCQKPSIAKNLDMKFCLPSQNQAQNLGLTRVGYVIRGEIGEGEVLSGPYVLSSTLLDGRVIRTNYPIDERCTNVFVAAYFQREGDYSEVGAASFPNDETLRLVNLDFSVSLSDSVILPTRGEAIV